MKLLLHTCCGPCLIYPAQKLKKDKIEATAFFCNSNIYPLDEYHKRRMGVIEASNKQDIEVIFSEYIPSEYTNAIKENTQVPVRCQLCWSLRLRKTAQEAKAKGFYGFSTTLLVSPYQDHEELKRIGNEISQEVGVYFHYEDFRPGFKKAQAEAKKLGIYLQNYCGCSYSEMERCEKPKKK